MTNGQTDEWLDGKCILHGQISTVLNLQLCNEKENFWTCFSEFNVFNTFVIYLQLPLCINRRH
jgi:hypothetical protein